MDQRDLDLERLPPVEAYIQQRNGFYELPWSKRVYPQWSCSEPPQLSDWHPIRPPRLDFQFRAFVFDREDNIEYFIAITSSTKVPGCVNTASTLSTL